MSESAGRGPAWSTAVNKPRPRAGPRTPPVALESQRKWRAGRCQRAPNVILPEGRLVVSGLLHPDLVEDKLLWEGILTTVHEHLAIFEKPLQVSALVVPVVQGTLARGYGCNCFLAEGLPPEGRQGRPPCGSHESDRRANTYHQNGDR